MDKYTRALAHVNTMGLSPAQISAIFSDKAQYNDHLDWVLSLDRAAALEYLEPNPVDPPAPVVIKKGSKKK